MPTWNYVVVQARGVLRAVGDTAWLRAFVTRLTERHEAGLPQPWQVSDAPAAYIDQMLRAIVGIEIRITALTGKWKVSQNRSAPDRAGVAEGLAAIEQRQRDAAPTMSGWVAPAPDPLREGS